MSDTTPPSMPEPPPYGPGPVLVDDPKKPWKAVVGGALAAVAAFLTYWIADEDPFTAKEAGEALLAALAAAGLIGGGAYAVPNPKKVKPVGSVDERGAAYVSVGTIALIVLIVVLLVVLL